MTQYEHSILVQVCSGRVIPRCGLLALTKDEKIYINNNNICSSFMVKRCLKGVCLQIDVINH